MNYFDEVLTEDEISKIEKQDCLYVRGVVSLDDEETQKKLTSYAYEMYLRKMKEENKKGGDENE